MITPNPKMYGLSHAFLGSILGLLIINLRNICCNGTFLTTILTTVFLGGVMVWISNRD